MPYSISYVSSLQSPLLRCPYLPLLFLFVLAQFGTRRSKSKSVSSHLLSSASTNSYCQDLFTQWFKGLLHGFILHIGRAKIVQSPVRQSAFQVQPWSVGTCINSPILLEYLFYKLHASIVSSFLHLQFPTVVRCISFVLVHSHPFSSQHIYPVLDSRPATPLHRHQSFLDPLKYS